MVRFLHTSDWHLGISRYYLEGEAQARFGQARVDVIRRVAALAIEERCDFALVCGDVFDSNHVEREIVIRALEALAETPRITFYLLPGNHDPLDASSVYRSPTFSGRSPANVVVLRDSAPLQLAEGVELVAAPWHSKDPRCDLIGRACDGLGRANGLRIVAGHGQIDSFSHSHHQQERVVLGELERHLQDGLIHYVALGDRHSRTEVGTTGRIWYSGAPEPTDFREIDPGHVLLVSLGADHATVEERTVGQWQFVGHSKSDLSDENDLDDLREVLSDLRPKERTVVRLVLGGRISLKQKATLDDLIEDHRDPLAALEVDDQALLAAPDDSDLEEFGFSGFARQALQDLRNMAEVGKEAPVAREALVLLRRLIAKSR